MRGLPPGGALHRAVDPAAHWGTTDELLAGLCELVDQSNRLFVQAHSKKGARRQQPLRIARPGQRQDRRRQSSGEELAMFLNGS